MAANESTGTDHTLPVSDPPSGAGSGANTSVPAATTTEAPALPVIIKHLKGKEAEWSTITRKAGPLGLLDLPVDVLGLIVREVQSHNDLTSLALTNSTLYNLATPLIYSEFDIVWPDDSSSSAASTGVDALTYGLSTLCLGSRFAHKTRWLRRTSLARVESSHRLASNQYATYVRKFSLGNGKETEVAEYSLGQDSGKMLGTLVALAVAKMINLESFVWDMPTGVPSDVFMGLASLQDHSPEGRHKLSRVWVRWQGDVTVRPASPSTISSGYALPVHSELLDFFMGVAPQPSRSPSPRNLPLPPHLQPKEPTSKRYAECKVEYPTFSILPALESLSVLDITEMAYLDELSELVERSRSSIRELRIGLASSAKSGEINLLCHGDKFKQIDLTATWPGESSLGDKRLGGVLGVVFGRIFDLKTNQLLGSPAILHQATKSDVADLSLQAAQVGIVTQAQHHLHPDSQPVDSGGLDQTFRGQQGHREGKLTLGLRTLELEKLAVSVQICQNAIDWSCLTTLTILDCTQHESLWRMLRKEFQLDQPADLASHPGQRYPLSLKHIRTDQVSVSLITFLRETLAPNSLEGLYLQARRASGTPAVGLTQIMKGPVRRHQASLRNLRLDSVFFREGPRVDPVSSGIGRSHWAFSSSWVTYLTSGRMRSLRELAISFDTRAWHPFLRGLPNLPELRTLHVLGLPNRTDPSIRREIAVQVADILTLRPDSKLSLLGINDICFEIMEAHTSKKTPPDVDLSGLVVANGVIVDDPGTDVDSTTSSTSDSDAPAVPPPPPPVVFEVDDVVQENPEEWSSQHSSGLDSDTDSWQGSEGVQKTPHRWLYLHQVPFRDDKVDVFRARHARL
ncbi:uncharacterized protein B0I36DRAFT_317365 [Microdochium trichocladiopsis]|uniref:F-box domain-containing protein n=1 Tax=Microdochium trichocladiopsis TaxID=1682393 RepID=A0A9P8YBS7_9PEZI|nr:uncharacterized protein B0I36DRAFT_317365 [Microdochium trichocladiopsis]KAH7034985.1 hypothetical protein B0I36DRAFT_317365 [Microdochium trichocladiopsis]